VRASGTAWRTTPLHARRFPDGELFLRADDPDALRGAAVACVMATRNPDADVFAALLGAALARDLGASSVGVIAPYLPYLRQDDRFHAGEAVTARYVAELLGLRFDWIVTVDPHTHRIPSLDALFTIPAAAASAGAAIADWLARNVANPAIVGPDEESEQWVAPIATALGAPWTTLRKERRGDRDVTVTLTRPLPMRDHTPVVVDDIVSSGETIRAAVDAIAAHCACAPVVVCTHALFAPGADDALRGAARVVSANTVAHATNAVDVAPAIVDAVRQLTEGAAAR